MDERLVCGVVLMSDFTSDQIKEIEAAYRKCANSGDRELIKIIAELTRPEFVPEAGQVFYRNDDAVRGYFVWTNAHSARITEVARSLSQAEVGPGYVPAEWLEVAVGWIKSIQITNVNLEDQYDPTKDLEHALDEIKRLRGEDL